MFFRWQAFHSKIRLVFSIWTAPIAEFKKNDVADDLSTYVVIILITTTSWSVENTGWKTDVF